ncbi:ATP-grasp domain-containing protein [Salipaludibacillus sp. LMS25]|jgi:D-alanine-D-alanine ligase-like ATP-grasp enzyme/acylphosphatase|uniref:ATP-grasp domain-containing protein n=1 Tax=Salipaludibacillus sp. LMS25 TaxID=2924031 RepID=UPI0020D1A263|nr:ATP-grasp domain-containing protein [Salipaludibacillus sp. LMS25]UTR16212.1 ATP-grasp domain-containing protein [Salipaludibacillus sp. LMS25]
MDNMDLKWLPHLTPEVVEQAPGHLLCGYTIALEGWRRGLELKWYTNQAKEFDEINTWYDHNPGKLFSLSSEENTHYFFKSRGDLVTWKAVEDGKDKYQTKHIFKKSQVPTPAGVMCSSEQSYSEIMNLVANLNYPLVLKPVDGSFGRGVITEIKNKDKLISVFKEAKNSSQYNNIIIEEYIPGREFRLYVVNDQVVGAIERVPANVIGDGKTSIRRLIEKKNKKRRLNPRLKHCPIKINSELTEHLLELDYKLDDIPKKEEKVFLTKMSNISLGGDPIDRLDTLSSKVKKIAIEALRAFPDLPHGGVDIIVPSCEWEGVDEAIVLEVNPTAQIGSLLFPLEGRARDIPSAIIDYYFPESIATKKANPYSIFEFQKILPILKSKVVTSILIPKVINTKFSCLYKVSGDLTTYGHKIDLKEKADTCKLYGYLKEISSHSYELYICTDNEKNMRDYIQYVKEIRNISIREIEHNKFTMTKQHFEIKQSPKAWRNDEIKLKKVLSKLEKKNRLLKLILSARKVIRRIKSKLKRVIWLVK